MPTKDTYTQGVAFERTAYLVDPTGLPFDGDPDFEAGDFQIWNGSAYANGTIPTMLVENEATLVFTEAEAESDTIRFKLIDPDGLWIAVDERQVLHADSSQAILAAIQAVGPIALLPFIGTIPQRVSGKAIKVFTNETVTLSIPLVDGAGAPVNLEGVDLWFGIWNAEKIVQVEATPTGTLSGFTVEVPPIATQTRSWEWVLRKNDATELVLSSGPFNVRSAPRRIV